MRQFPVARSRRVAETIIVTLPTAEKMPTALASAGGVVTTRR